LQKARRPVSVGHVERAQHLAVNNLEQVERVPQQRVLRAVVALGEDRLGDGEEGVERERFALEDSY
jgi:hypothetical protein